MSESGSPATETVAPVPAGTPTPGVARSAGLVGIATMASRVLGLLRDTVFLTTFGAGHLMDAYNVAFRLPNLVRDLFAEGAMSAAFVPTFTRELHSKGKDAAWELGRIVITGLIVVTGVITIAGILLAGPLTAWVAPEYAATPGKLELTTTLTQVMFPFLMLIAVAVACMGMLNSLRSFFLPALAPAAFNVACIASAFLIVPFMPMLGWHAMVGLAIGTLLGGVAQVALQWPALIKAGFRFRPQFAFGDSRFREIVRLMIPGTVGLAAAQVNQLVNVYLATSEGEGAVTYLGYAFRLMYLPIGLFGVSIATAAIPGITRHAAAEDMEGVRNDVSQALRMMLMLNVPASFGLIALAGPIVELLIEYRNVNPANTAGIAAALMGYAPGLVGYSAVKIASPTFYALKNARTPVTIGMTCIFLNVVLNLLLVRTSLSYAGLALGTGIAALANAAMLFWMLRRRLGGLDDRRVITALVKVVAASTAMAAVAWGVEHQLALHWAGHEPWRRAVRVGLAISLGLAALALSARLLRLHEFEVAFGRVWSGVAGRLGRRRN
ncbi:MAG: murein biosynthesis integral membrane protein MurJ [Vicinamibacteraceae bacterium]